MGALTGVRKRCGSVDLCVPSSSCPIHPHPEIRGSLRLLLLLRRRRRRRRRSWFWINRRWAVHGPQRIVRVFGHGSEVGAGRRVSVVLVGGKEGGVGMGNIVSWTMGRASLHAPWSSHARREAPVERRGDRGFWDGDLDRLRVGERKKLVGDAGEDRSVAAAAQRSRETAAGEAIFPRSVSSVVSDFTATTREEDELLEDVGRSPLQADAVEARRSPVYKDLWDLPDPFTPLTDEEENTVNLALRDPDKLCLHNYGVLVFHDSSNIEITRDVIQCLRQGSWLNDEVINLYFELLKEREKREPTKFLKCHFFNTFFYEKLTSGRNSYDFQTVRRWTTLRKLGYGLIECDKIFVPIHKGMHWCLAVIDIKSEKLLYLDSLGGRDKHALRILARYFVDEVKDKNNKTINITSWKQEAVENLPLQENEWDCGMFMLKYADFLSRGLSLCFQQENMMYFRKRTAKEILRLRAE